MTGQQGQPRWPPHGWRLAGLVGILSGGGLAARLFIGGTIGVSDQGDGTRLLCSLGVRQSNPYNSSTADYLYLKWLPHHWFGETCGATGSGEPYDSSELWILRAAHWLTPALNLGDGLDLRALGVLFCLIVALAMGVLFAVLPGSPVARLVAVAVVWLVVADGAFAGYFVSAYSEPAALVGILALVLAVMLFWRRERGTWWTAALVGAACLFTITAKTQAASLLVTVIPLLLWRSTFGASVVGRMATRLERGASVGWRHRVGAAMVSRWPAAVVSIMLVTVTVGYLQGQPRRYEVQNRYAAVFLEMLPHSPNPAQDLRRLGLDPALSSSSGHPINAPGSAASLPSFAGFADKVSPVRTTLVYVRQPLRLLGMLHRGLEGMGVLRADDGADYVSSYPPSAGEVPGARECRICVVQWMWKAFFGTAWILILFVTLAAIGICRRLARTRRDRRYAAVGVAGLLLATSAIAQFWVVMLSEGASDLIKHMLLADFMTALLIALAGYSVHLMWTTKPDAPGFRSRRDPDERS